MTWKEQRSVIALASGVWRYVVAASAMRMLVAAGRIGIAVLVADVLRDALDGRGIRTVAVVLLTLWMALQFAVDVASRAATQRAASATKSSLRTRLFEKLAELGPTLLGGERTGQMQAALVSDIEAMETYFSEYLPALAVACVVPLTVCAWLGADAPELGAVVLAFALGAAFLPGLFAKPLAKTGKARMVAYLDLGAAFLDVVQGMVTLKMFGAARRRRAELGERSDRVSEQGIKELFIALASMAIVTLMTLGGLATTIALASHHVARGRIDVGTAFLALFLTREAMRPFAELARAVHDSMSAVTAAEQIHRWLGTASPAPAPAHAVPAPRGPVRAEFDGVSFAYASQNGRNARVLDAVSFSVEPGETLALVGPSGAGKTTVLSLLLRFVLPQKGRVLLGGVDVRDMKADDVRSLMAVVSQDTYLFAGSVRENLMLARPDADAVAMEAAARAADAHDFILGLPRGYDTVLGERGQSLSGGQRQRLSLARAFLRNAPILVLDEPTANVDARSEAGILAAIRGLARDKTTIVVAHRLSSVRDAQRILVLESGRAVESGAHRDLLARGGAYARIVAEHEVA